MKYFFVVLSALVLLTSCSKESDGCEYDACAGSAPASEVTELENWLASASITATKHCSGLYYTINIPGSGATPGVCSFVNVKYKGHLTNGNVFDESVAPVGFRLGNLIESWKKSGTPDQSGWKDHILLSSFTCLR